MDDKLLVIEEQYKQKLEELEKVWVFKWEKKILWIQIILHFETQQGFRN